MRQLWLCKLWKLNKFWPNLGATSMCFYVMNAYKYAALNMAMLIIMLSARRCGFIARLHQINSRELSIHTEFSGGVTNGRGPNCL